MSMKKAKEQKEKPIKYTFGYFDWQDDRLRDEFEGYDLSKPEERKAAYQLALHSIKTGFLEAKQE